MQVIYDDGKGEKGERKAGKQWGRGDLGEGTEGKRKSKQREGGTIEGNLVKGTWTSLPHFCNFLYIYTIHL